MKTNYSFGGIEPEFSNINNSAVLLQPIPFDGTSTWGKGSDKSLDFFLEASENMELYDIETDSEVYKKGIHILPPIMENNSPEELYKIVYCKTKDLLKTEKFLSFLGGEHSISIGIIDAFSEQYNDLTVLQLDAHADLRSSYLNSEFNHACAMHRACKNTNLIQVGIRSMDIEEKEYMDLNKTFFADDIYLNDDWMERSIEKMTNNIYISIDLDVFDPSIMPSTGTPEPGGLNWNNILIYLKKIFRRKTVVGFDIVEFAPIQGLKAPNFLVSKLFYKLLSYKFYGK